MAKSARASVIKKNKSKLKSRVFGPVEQARAERLSKKLLELAQQPKPSEEVKLNAADTKVDDDNEDEGSTMEVDSSKAPTSQPRSNTALKKAKETKKGRIEKKRHRKERNRIAFKSHPMKSKKGSKR